MLFNVKDAQYHYGLTQQDIAEAFGVSQGLISVYAKLGDDFQIEIDDGFIVSWVRVIRDNDGGVNTHTKNALAYE